MSDQYLGEIRIFGCNYAPRGWAQCNGQSLPIGQNTALFSILGTNYGGDGRTTFGLPNLQGAAALNQGNGAGLSEYVVGETGGQSSVTLIITQMAAHTHAPNAKTSGGVDDPNGQLWGNPPGRPGPNFSATSIGQATAMHPQALGLAGGGQAHNNLMPYTVMNFCIALQGIYPPRP